MSRGHSSNNGRASWLSVLALVVVLLTGCSNGESSAPNGTTVQTSASVSPTSDRSATDGASQVSSASIDQTSAKSTAQPALLSDEEALDRYLSEAAQSFGLTGETPDVAIVRRIKPEEKASVVIQCLRDKGFPVTESGVGAFSVDVPPEQQDAAGLAQYECLAAYPPEARFLQPMGTQQYTAIYRYYTRTLVPCLAENGYPQTDPVPTEQTFLDSLGTPEEWNPYSAVPDGGGTQEWDGLKRACPQEAPSDEVYPPN